MAQFRHLLIKQKCWSESLSLFLFLCVYVCLLGTSGEINEYMKWNPMPWTNERVHICWCCFITNGRRADGTDERTNGLQTS